MKFSAAALLATALPAVTARFADKNEPNNVVLHPNEVEAETYLVELSPGETRWVTEEDKWDLRRVSCNP